MAKRIDENSTWWDVYRLWQYALGTKDPLSQRIQGRTFTGAGVSQPDAVPDIRQDGSFWSGGRGQIRLRDSNDFIDLSSVTNRASRYKEYERLRNVAEIETAMTVFADESCLTGDTIVSTLFYGPKPIKWLVDNKANEEFLVYCWDFAKEDYSLGWAFNPRMTKIADTVKIRLDDGTTFRCTPDHRILMADTTWKEAGELTFGDDLMPFYRIPNNPNLNNLKTNQFPRIFTHEGWKHERYFIDEWKGQHEGEKDKKINKVLRLVASGLTTQEIQDQIGHQWKTIESWMHKAGFTLKELRHLGKRSSQRKVVGVTTSDCVPVYDLSVKGHENFCGESVIFHNCQNNDDGNVCDITVKNKKVKNELEFLLFHREMLNVNRRLWNWSKNLYIFGDLFLELVIDQDNPKEGLYGVQMLPPDSLFRIETTKGRLIEFQQSKEGPDFESLNRSEVTKATEAELRQSTAIRFDPNSVIHGRIGEDRKTFYPYGVSLIEAARGPAHQLRLMEDAMVVYRLTRAPERRVFYVDIGQLPHFKAEAFLDRMKDQFRKKKVATSKSGGVGASAVEERWHAPAQDEDYWIPVRPNSNTRVETLPGAQNLGEIDDAVYFRNKLFTAMNFPKNYFSNEDPNATRITLSAQDVKFARQIERLQATMEDMLWEMCNRHLKLQGYPEELYEDLIIKLTPPSDWRELSRAEVLTNRINNANSFKGSQLLSDHDIYVDWLKFPEEDAKIKLSRLKIQKLEDLKIQVLAQNPQLLGVGMPGQGEQEIGAAPGGPNPMLGPGGEGSPPAFAQNEPPPPAPGPEAANNPPPTASPGEGASQQQMQPNGVALVEPELEDLRKYDLEIQNYAREMDEEDIDYSEL
jgi:hypothetical protein